MNRKLFALVGLFIALIPPTLFVMFHLIDSTAFAALAITMMGGVGTYIHSVALEDAAEKSAGGQPAAPTIPPPPPDQHPSITAPYNPTGKSGL